MRRSTLGSRLAVRFALLLLLVAVAAIVWLRAIDQLNWSGPRVVYFFYVAGLLLAALVVSRWPKLAWTLLLPGKSIVRADKRSVIHGHSITFIGTA